VENERDFDHYLENPVSINEKVTIDDEVHRMDHILLQLRTHRGIDLKNYKRLFGENNDLQMKAGAYISSKQLIIEKDHLKATEEGFLILDRITEDLVTPMR
jgi:coproporphyrinogen III oxidase-like Fe-S oxidoreductase